MNLKVFLPVFNQPGYTEMCIQFLTKNKADFDLCIIDNGSLMQTKAIINKYGKKFQYRIFRIVQNEGWARALNLALSNEPLECDFCVLLHNDCFVGPDFFARIEKGLEQADPQAKVFLPKTNYSRSPLLIENEEIAHQFAIFKHPNKGIPKTKMAIRKLLKDVYSDFSNYTNSLAHLKELSFCNIIDSYCLIVDSKVFKERLYFNESFKTLGWVEQEWNDRVNKAGYEAWILNNVFVHHHGNLTTDGEGFNYPELLVEDKRLYREITDGCNSENKTNPSKSLS